jgi:hypothetical protein
MNDSGSRLVSRLAAVLGKPEYTGEQRCWPCTVVNAVVLAVVSLVVAVSGRRLLALVVATVGTVLIAVRGYVVPGTPRFAPALVSALPVPDDWFHGPEPTTTGTLAGDPEGEAAGDQVMAALLESGVLEPDGEMLYLAEAFEERWHAAMADAREASMATLADRVSGLVAGSAESLTVDGGEWLLLETADGGELMLSRAVVIAELTAARVLEDHVDDPDLRVAAARPLRMFLESCPACGTDLEESNTVSCCGGHTGPQQKPRDVLSCPECEQRIYTFPPESDR